MQIWTSYWLAALPASIQKIGISRTVPRGYPAGYRRIRDLEPGPWFNITTPPAYYDLYRRQLERIDAEAIVARIAILADDKTEAALLCFETGKPGDWCHRAMVSEWLNDALNLHVPEWGDAQQRVGRDHPLWPKDVGG
jgi:hypothetical protein